MVIQRLIDLFSVDLANPNFYIQGINIPSKKNSKRWTGTHIISSKNVTAFERNISLVFSIQKSRFLEVANATSKPILLGMYLIRDTKREFDYNNITQVILDEMEEHGYLSRDNMDNVVVIPLGYEVNKKECGVKCFIL